MMIFRVLIGTWLIFLMSCNSLQELQKANLKRQQDAHARMKDQYVTLEKPSDTNVKVSGDGLKIDSTHYSLSFSEDLQQHTEYDTVSERQQSGHGYLVFMESLYQFIYQIFGFDIVSSNKKFYKERIFDITDLVKLKEIVCNIPLG